MQNIACDRSLLDYKGKIPKISIITPSYNQGEFIEETLRSVLLQGYPNLEYIVIDGGSTDDSVEIIKKYEKDISYWVSEPDKGQANAINKGFEIATGDIIGWLNSDDLFEENCLINVEQFFIENERCDFLYGDSKWVDKNNTEIYYCSSKKGNLKKLVCCEDFISQPSMFFKKSFLDSIGGLDESLSYALDLELKFRCLLYGKYYYIPISLSRIRIHENTKSNSQYNNFFKEHIKLLERFLKNQDLINYIDDDKNYGKLVNKARGSVYLRGGLGYYCEGNSKQCRTLLWQAMVYNMRNLYNIQWYLCIITARYGKKVFRIKNRFANKRFRID